MVPPPRPPRGPEAGAGGGEAALVLMTGLDFYYWLLMAGELGVDADVIERAGQDRDNYGACARAAHLVVEIISLRGGDQADDQPDHQDNGAESHIRLNFLVWYFRGRDFGSGKVA